MTGAPRVTASPPPADLPVDQRRVELLCARLRPEQGVDLGRVEWSIGPVPAGEGWDNVLWPVGLLDGRPLVLRVVRRESARPQLLRESTVLRHLREAGSALTMRIPTLLATAEGAVLLPWYDGIVAADAEARVLRETGRDLAEMLAAVHSGPVPEIDANPVRGVPLATRTNAFAEDLGRARLTVRLAGRARGRWQAGLAAADWSGDALLLHGDPHPGNVVLPSAADGGPAVLIDWGDTTPGDPASDLGGLLLYDPSEEALLAYREFATWTGIEDDQVWDALVARAWAWGSRLALALVTAYPLTYGLGSAGQRLLVT